MSGTIYPKMAVIGCGLIGASVILAARASGAVGEVAVADASPAARARIEALGFADLVTLWPSRVVAAQSCLACGAGNRRSCP